MELRHMFENQGDAGQDAPADTGGGPLPAVVYCYEDVEVGEAAHVMSEFHVDWLAVVRRTDRRLVGAVTWADIARALASGTAEGRAFAYPAAMMQG